MLKFINLILFDFLKKGILPCLFVLANFFNFAYANQLEDQSHNLNSKMTREIEEAPILLPAQLKMLRTVETANRNYNAAEKIPNNFGAAPFAANHFRANSHNLMRHAAANSSIKVMLANSSASGTAEKHFVPEPPLPPGVAVPTDLEQLGYGRASLIAHSKWSTIRYLGERPAGYGLEHGAVQAAQRLALGNPNDVLPVATSAAVIHAMMEEYFAPLLSELPGGQAIAQGIHVQGAYVSPTFNPHDGYRIDFDNAFVVGLQSLYIYPSSCYHRPNPTICTPPFLSTGHDATVIGHELGHVVFNAIRHAKSPKGFQWFAVNEGYADFFSASFFETPLVGQTWQSNQVHAPYLRRLLDNPHTRDEKVLASAHAFSVVWSSLLWRMKTRLEGTSLASARAFDKAVLFSIFHLGEGGGSQLGDAATALLKATYQLGFMNWDSIMREEIARSKIELKAENLEQLSLKPYQNGTRPSQRSEAGFGCTIGRGGSANGPDFVLFPLLFVPLLLRHMKRPFKKSLFFSFCKELSEDKETPNAVCAQKTHKGGFDAVILAASRMTLISLLAGFVLCAACVRKPKQKLVTSIINPESPIDYQCNLALFSQAALESQTSHVRIARASDQGSQESVLMIVYDSATADPSSAAQIVYDRVTKRVDRILEIDGKPIASDLVSSTSTVADAQRFSRAMLGLLLFEEAPRAQNQAQVDRAGKPFGTTKKTEGFKEENVSLTSAGGFFVNVQFSRTREFWDLGIKIPELIQAAGQTICSLQ